MSDSPAEPETPLHARANEQLDLRRVKELDEKDIDDLDLDPAFEDSLPPSKVASTADLLGNNGVLKRPAPNSLENTEDEDDNSSGVYYRTTTTTTNNNVPGKRNHETNSAETSQLFDNVDDFKPRINVNSPFASYDNSALKTIPTTTTNKPLGRRLSMSQQSKFVTYVDQRFMDIQRKFVQSRGLNNITGYKSLEALLKDIKSLLDFIWYSIDNTPNTDNLLKSNDSDNLIDSDITMSSNVASVKSINDFGQTSYIIKIADDLLDYIEKFHIEADDTSTISKIFKLFFILDKIFIKLINGNSTYGIRINKTDMVRFVGIAERSRVRLPAFFERLNIHGYHYELSKVYEGSLDQCA